MRQPAIALTNLLVEHLVEIVSRAAIGGNSLASRAATYYRVEPWLMRYYNLTVGRNDDIQLKCVNAQFQRMQKGWKRILGAQAPAAAMAMNFRPQ